MSFKVRIEPGGHEFVARAGETVLAAAQREGHNLAYSCRNGACGTCKGRLLSGAVNYGDYEERALTSAEKAAGHLLLCQAIPLADVVIEAQEINAPADVAVRILPCRVARMERVAHDVMILHLKLAQNERLRFLAGQYIEILLGDGKRRGFSLANAPHDDEWLQLHIRHVPGGIFSGYVFNQMKEKSLLRFQGPLGTFFLREESARPIILVAGGTGFAPMKSLVEHAFHSGVTRPIHLYWGARARRDLYLHDLAEGWMKQYENFRYTPVLSEALPGDDWRGRQGNVHEAVAADYPDLRAHEVYASGPPGLIEAAKSALLARGLEADRLYYDSFEYAKDPAARGTAV